MTFHRSAWDGVNIVVYGETPLLAMKLEQSIAQISPSDEGRLESFEDYSASLNFCKTSKKVGLVLLSDDIKSAPIAPILKNLGTPYHSARGLQCFGVLMSVGERTIEGYQALAESQNFLAYISVNDVLDSKKTHATWSMIWDEFSARVESSLVPEVLGRTLRALANDVGLDFESQTFMTRATNLICARLNVSWIERISLGWTHVVRALAKNRSSAVSANQSLEWLYRHSQFDDLHGLSVEEISQSKSPLANRIAATISNLDEHRRAGSLERRLTELAVTIKPYSPALLRNVVSERDRILSFANQNEITQASQEKAG